MEKLKYYIHTMVDVFIIDYDWFYLLYRLYSINQINSKLYRYSSLFDLMRMIAYF